LGYGKFRKSDRTGRTANRHNRWFGLRGETGCEGTVREPANRPEIGRLDQTETRPVFENETNTSFLDPKKKKG
ncbi:hypothetical protein PIB30_065324, partial [Stylosanthes scabra]|nr:hypothetical protein [Stylosanthes scabra]